MSELISAVKAWPTIVQGALGSALFWVILLIAQKLFDSVLNHLSNRTKKQRIRWLVSRECKHNAFRNASDSTSAFATSALIYRSLQQVYRALLWLGLGVIVQYFFELGIVIGGLGFIYYVFKAYEEVAPFKEGENTTEAHKAVIDELIKLGKRPPVEDSETNNSSNTDDASSTSS